MNTVERLRAFLETRPEVLAAYVFGSTSRGTAGPLSDLDVGLLVDRASAPRPPFGYLAEVTASVMRAVGRDDVDVVLLDEAPPLLAHRVVRDGRVVHTRDERARVRFHAETIRRYLDTRPLRDLRRRAIAVAFPAP